MFNKRKTSWIVILLMLGVMQCAIADLPIYSPSQLAVIKERGYIKVGIYSSTVAPFVIYGKDNELTGIDIELAKQIGDLLGVKVVFDNSAKTLNDLIQHARDQRDDIVMSGIIRTAGRSRLVNFSYPYYRFHIGILVNRLRFDQLSKPIETIFNQSDITLGEVSGSAYVGYVKTLYPKAKLKLFNTDEDVFHAVQAGDVDAAMVDELVVHTWLANEPARALDSRYYIIPKFYATYAIATSYNDPVLAKWLSSVTRTAIDIGFTQRLLDKYIQGHINARWQ